MKKRSKARHAQLAVQMPLKIGDVVKFVDIDNSGNYPFPIYGTTGEVVGILGGDLLMVRWSVPHPLEHVLGNKDATICSSKRVCKEYSAFHSEQLDELFAEVL